LCYYIIGVIKSTGIRWGGYVARMGERSCSYRVLMGRPEEEGNVEDSNLDGSIKLKQILKNWDRGTWSGLIWLRIGTDCVLL
jgi:hypothetical protein